MSEYVIQGQTLTGIADAIRAQLGTEQQYTPESMAAAIGSIQGGDKQVEADLIGRSISDQYSNDLVKSVGNSAFKGCSKLKNVKLINAKSVSGSGFFSCTAISTIYLPMVENVGSQAFFSCNVAKIFYSRNLRLIDAQAFFNFGASIGESSSIIIAAEVVATLRNTNGLQGFKGGIYVPDDLVEEYKVAANWATYAAQIKGLSEIPADVQEWLDQQVVHNG